MAVVSANAFLRELAQTLPTRDESATLNDGVTRVSCSSTSGLVSAMKRVVPMGWRKIYLAEKRGSAIMAKTSLERFAIIATRHALTCNTADPYSAYLGLLIERACLDYFDHPDQKDKYDGDVQRLLLAVQSYMRANGIFHIPHPRLVDSE